MQPHPDPALVVAAILNAAWMVRHYARGSRRSSGWLVEQRTAAIRQLGHVCRDAFNRTEDFEPLFRAIVEGLVPHDEPRF